MPFERSRSSTDNQIMGSGPKINLIEHTVFRKQQLEKILFAYHNLYRLHPSYTKMVSEAFQSKNSLLLWNFENDCLLNSRELEDLMKQDCRQFNESQGNYNGKNLVNTLNVRHKKLPLPCILPKKKGKVLMKTGPPQKLMELAFTHPDSVQVGTLPPNQQSYQNQPEQMDFPIPSQPCYSQQGPSQPCYSQQGPPIQGYVGSSDSMSYNVPLPQNPACSQPMPPTGNMYLHPQQPYHFPPPTNSENMVFPISGQSFNCPPSQHYYPTPPNQMSQNPSPEYYGPPPLQMIPQMVQIMPPQQFQQQQAPPQMLPQMVQMVPSVDYQSQAPPAGPPISYQAGPIISSQPMAPPMIPHTPQMNSYAHPVPNHSFQPSPTYENNTMPCGPPPAPIDSNAIAGYLVPYAAEQVNCQPPGHLIDPNHPEIVYDPSGYAYRRMVVTTTCLVPIQQCTAPPYPPGQISTDAHSAQDIYEQVDVQELESNDADKPDDSDTGIEDCGSQTPVDTAEHEEETVEIMESEETDEPTLVDERSEDIDDDLVSSSVESECLADTPTEGSEVDDDNEHYERMDTPVAKVVTNNPECEQEDITNEFAFESPNQADNCAVVLPALSLRVEIQKTVVIEEVVNDEDAQQTPPATPSSGRKQKLTKKQKRIQAAEKAKELETDDAILEEALKSKQEYLAANGLAEPVESPATPTKTSKAQSKKKNRDQMKVIIEKVTLSSPAPQLINPQIMHRIKTAIHARARSLEESGRPKTNPNIYRQKFFEAVIEFEKSFVPKSDDSSDIKQFIEKRIAFFRTLSPALSFSRITIYEHLYVDIPEPLLIEIRFLMSLPTENVEQVVQLEEFEDIFLSLF